MLPFVKMHGLGNDFVIVNKLDLPAVCDIHQLAKIISDRHTGIGADQFIIYEKKLATYNMSIYNQDGSIAETCGNASRCVTKLMNKKFGDTIITLEVKGRKVICEMVGEDLVSVNMGKVSFNEGWMPKDKSLWTIAERYTLEPKEITCVDIGNPHIIIFSNLSDNDKFTIGQLLQTDELFLKGVNVNFASVRDNKIYLKVWERGAGFTLACGSGACATFAAAVKLNFIKNDCEVVFELGSLKMKKNNENIIMTGSTNFVAEGIFYNG